MIGDFAVNLHALRIFHEVARQEHVTRAAEACSLSQPAVTAQIRNLERELGLTLVKPQGRSICLTQAGEQLYLYSRRLFSLEQEMESSMARWREGKRGRLVLCSTAIPSYALLPGWVVRFKARHPEVEVKLIRGNSREVFSKLREREAELGVVAGGWEEPGIQRRILWQDELCFIVLPDHPFAVQRVSLSRLLQEPFIYREEGSSTRMALLNVCEGQDLPPPPVGLESEGLFESIRAVAAGYGAMLVPATAVREELRRGEVARVQVDGISFRRPIALCFPEGEELSPPARRFVDMVAEEEVGDEG